VIALAARRRGIFVARRIRDGIACKFEGGFGGFGTAGSEVDAAVANSRSEGEKPGGEFFGGAEWNCVCGEGDLEACARWRRQIGRRDRC